jgi:hypothetical protein
MAPKTKIKADKKNPGRPSKHKTTLAVLRHMLTTPARYKGRYLKKQGRYEKELETLPVETVAAWLGVKPDFVRKVEGSRPGYRLTEEKIELLSHQTAVSQDWLLAGNPKAPPLNRYAMPYSQSDFDNRQIELAKRPRQVRQQLVSLAFARNSALIAEILLRASEQKKFDAYAASLKTTLGNLYYSLTDKPTSLVGNAVMMANAKGIRRAFDSLLDSYSTQLKKVI